MSDRVFSNSEVCRVFQISQRRLINIAEKGLVVAFKDAVGAGSRREWSYENLVEIGLVQSLFKDEHTIHVVKRIMSALRREQALKVWVKDFDAAFTEFAKRQKGWFEREHGKEAPQEYESTVRELKPPRPEGTIVLCFGVEASETIMLIPLNWTRAKDLLPGIHWFLSNSTSAGIIDLGKVKRQVDLLLEHHGLVAGEG